MSTHASPILWKIQLVLRTCCIFVVGTGIRNIKKIIDNNKRTTYYIIADNSAEFIIVICTTSYESHTFFHEFAI
jgi:hypothetical protein